jgi:hypothetical protein
VERGKRRGKGGEYERVNAAWVDVGKEGRIMFEKREGQ